jgi:hypothetical protein
MLFSSQEPPLVLYHIDTFNKRLNSTVVLCCSAAGINRDYTRILVKTVECRQRRGVAAGHQFGRGVDLLQGSIRRIKKSIKSLAPERKALINIGDI